MQNDVESFLMNEAVEHASDYARRGRLFKSLSQEQLAQQWCAAFREMADNPPDLTSALPSATWPQNLNSAGLSARSI
jgi:hypothetical protein